jgi:anti-sigma28 factor (negative regulator of flagellin synthesis)
MSPEDARRARLERVRTKVKTGEYQPDPQAIADAILVRGLARLKNTGS